MFSIKICSGIDGSLRTASLCLPGREGCAEESRESTKLQTQAEQRGCFSAHAIYSPENTQEIQRLRNFAAVELLDKNMQEVGQSEISICHRRSHLLPSTNVSIPGDGDRIHLAVPILKVLMTPTDNI